jgi:hypothetical protein
MKHVKSLSNWSRWITAVNFSHSLSLGFGFVEEECVDVIVDGLSVADARRRAFMAHVGEEALTPRNPGVGEHTGEFGAGRADEGAAEPELLLAECFAAHPDRGARVAFVNGLHDGAPPC